MSLGVSLSLVIAAFLAMMTAVMTLAFRERRASRHIALTDTAAQAASDTRIVATIFGSIIGGMLLMVVTAVLIFV
jgi:hypothetical protein